LFSSFDFGIEPTITYITMSLAAENQFRKTNLGPLKEQAKMWAIQVHASMCNGTKNNKVP
jgi:hypothetical protein